MGAERDINKSYTHHNQLVTFDGRDQLNTFNMHWVSSGGDGQPIIVAIHGTPGGWGAWSDLMMLPEIKSDFKLLAIDRPGWGKSTSDQIKVLPAFEDQANIIASWLKPIVEREQQPVILLGHSWGGPVIAQLAIDYPELVAAIVTVAGPFNASLSNPRWYNKLADNRLISWLIGSSLRRSNEEMMPLAKQLALMAPHLSSITGPVEIIQGGVDGLVNKENATFFANSLKNAKVKLHEFPQQGHFIPFNNPEIISAVLIQLASSSE